MFMVLSCVVRNLLVFAGSAAVRRRKKASTGGGGPVPAEDCRQRNPESRSGKTWETFDHDRTPLSLQQQMGQLAQNSSVDRGINGQGLGAAGLRQECPSTPWDTGWWRPDTGSYSH